MYTAAINLEELSSKSWLSCENVVGRGILGGTRGTWHKPKYPELENDNGKRKIQKKIDNNGP